MKPRVLTIAGSDSGGGAGIQADLKTITALGGFGMSAVTALTAQNTVGVRGVFEVTPEFVAAQIDAVVEDLGVDAAKTGMLASGAIIEVVAQRVRRHRIRPLVVDPVMAAQSGDPLIEPGARRTLQERLLPAATLVTPNLSEAAELSGRAVTDLPGMREAARRIRQFGPQWVLVKGGHLPGAPTDLLFDGADFYEISRPRIETENTHGTGCTYSAAIATGLAMGKSVPEAVEWARDALQAALRASLPLGRGRGPLDHGAMFCAGETTP
ncbi:MAG: bifunctional hydroxymethylpyrimidine kinase/phosphomethylpyrimidine kinase [Planctomycetes bacterium]|nr:bifunctional hydroxymethylpyrimidine kinase/phosphomethylpyrimidine kinase [Planctomycetota bacterium]